MSEPSPDRTVRLERLFLAHFDAVDAYARRRTDAASAEEVVSETFLVAWRRLDDVPADPLPWLLGVARRALANQRRGERRRAAVVSRVRDVRADDVRRAGPALGSELEAALMALSHAEREAILLIAWEGLTPRQAAAVLGCSAVAFRVRLHRARRRLGAALRSASSAADLNNPTTARSTP